MELNNLKPAGKEIKVLGTGCSKCKQLEKVVRLTVEEMGIEATVEKVEDIQEIMNFGVMTTPALVIDGQVVVKGKVPKTKEIKSLLST